MASLALLLKSHHRKTLLKISPNFTLSLHFSSSSDNNGENASKAPNFSFNLDEIKSRIKERDQHTQQHQNKQEQSMGPRPFRFAPQSPSNPPKATSFDEIKKNLSEYRRRSSAPTSASHSLVDSQQPILLQDIYKRNMAISTPNPNPNANPNQKFRNVDFNAIREGLRNMNASTAEKGKPGSQHLSLDKYRESFKPGPSMAESSRKVFGGSSEGLPTSVFGKEMTEREKKKKGEDGKDEMAKSELIRMYSYDELGDKLRNLRPESTKKEKGRKEGWFSLTELNERLKKLREIEENQSTGVFGIKEMRTSLHQIGGDATIKKQEFRRYDILGQLGGTPSFMLSPPKEHLVEKYFHPDNMSSEEKLKLELKRMRDEFKMHESDCGSTRVQIAQLTTEISHLSSLLHKKDKHSRRGLIAKVQQRKKLMKYLRRTDWDSYSFVLSKLGLRDNPDYKN